MFGISGGTSGGGFGMYRFSVGFSRPGKQTMARNQWALKQSISIISMVNSVYKKSQILTCKSHSKPFLKPTSTKQWVFLLKETVGVFNGAQTHLWPVTREKIYPLHLTTRPASIVKTVYSQHKGELVIAVLKSPKDHNYIITMGTLLLGIKKIHLRIKQLYGLIKREGPLLPLYQICCIFMIINLWATNCLISTLTNKNSPRSCGHIQVDCLCFC